MKKNDLLTYLTKVVYFNPDVKKILSNFYNENKDLPDPEFYTKFKNTFPWMEYNLKINELWRLKRIDNHLLFFKVITIISIVVGILIALSTIK